GDGAGLSCQLPQAFFKEEAKRLRLDGSRNLKPEDRLAVGVFFLDAAPARRDAARTVIQDVLSQLPYAILGWRAVPVRDGILAQEAAATKPAIEQLLIRVDGDRTQADLRLYRARLEMRERFRKAGLETSVSSLSSTLISYKGLLTSYHLV